MTKTILTSIIAALALAAPAQAINYPGSERVPALEAKLPTPVKVFCTQNTSGSFAILSDREIYLDKDTCSGLQGGFTHYSFARNAETLYHEWWHVAFQERNEKYTEAGTWTVLRYMLRTYWNQTPADAQEEYREATLYSPYAPIPYTFNTIDPLLEVTQ